MHEIELHTYRESRLLTALDKAGISQTAPDDVRAVIEEIRRSVEAQRSIAESRRLREKAALDDKRSVLDSDVELPKSSGIRCEASTANGIWRATRCTSRAKYIRTWATREWHGQFLNDKPVELDDDGNWAVADKREAGRGFVLRPLTEDEEEQVTAKYTEKENTIHLCGLHRLQKGRHGMPY